MDTLSDSDDSAFLFSANVTKRKAESNARNKVKKVRLNSEVDSTCNDMQNKEEIRTGGCMRDSVNVNNTILLKDEISTSNERLGETDAMEEVLPQKVDTQFSCPLCLKILHSESTHFSHMKQCAKKSKMSAKQLLEALQLHKKRLKERISAGLSNIPTKKKKNGATVNKVQYLQINLQKRAEDSTYQLAVGLALSKSLEDMGAGKENENFSDCKGDTGNTTLEKFGFTSVGKPSIGKKSKNSKLVNSTLKKRTNEDREKLLTEKASVVLLINDDTMIADTKESLRVYHCKLVEETRNKDSLLWKLGEDIEETHWYVEDLKKIILDENTEPEDGQKETNEEYNIDEEIRKLNLPKTTYFENWKILINNKHLSDLILDTKDNETIYMHSVVLYARCPSILESDLKKIVNCFESGIVLKFLQYLYCGTLDGLAADKIEDLLNLAQLLGYQELLDVLSCLKDSSSGKTDSGIDHDIPKMDGWCEWGRASPNMVLSDGNHREYDELNYVEESLHDGEEQTRMDESDRCEPRESLRVQPDGESCTIMDDGRSGIDMFEEEENLNKSMNGNNGIGENDPDCVEISSGSIKSDATQMESRENENILSDLDYEIPYFDPYEHFNSEIPDTEPLPGAESESQSLIVGEISPVKSDTPKTSLFVNISPCAAVPGCCSTPNEVPLPSTSAQADFHSNKRPVKKRKYATPCSRINRKSGRFLSSKPRKKGNFAEMKSKIGPVSENVGCVLTESILRELEKSIGTKSNEEKNYVEVTPVIPGEEFVENVSPLPDYSVMGASSIKKHLMKYGLKKNLSKNKAKKILRHIYEELHPILNMKNGKIVKYVQSDKPKKQKERKVVKKSAGRKTLTPTRAEQNKKEVEWSQPETPIKTSSCSPPKTDVEEDRKSCTSSGGESAWTSLSDGSCSEVEEQLSQSSSTSATDAPLVVYDYILNNPDVRRQVLMYEPLVLEDLQRTLFEKYNKIFTLTNLMDCLDEECVTFRCESQEKEDDRRK